MDVTNYVMLELILTRIRDKDLVTAAQGLSFLVLDELGVTEASWRSSPWPMSS